MRIIIKSRYEYISSRRKRRVEFYLHLQDINLFQWWVEPKFEEWEGRYPTDTLTEKQLREVI